MASRKYLSVLLVFALVVSILSAPLDAFAKTRSAEQVLEDIIYVKQQWEGTTSQSRRNALHNEAEDLRKELLRTKEYLNNIKVSSRNFLVEKGKDPGFAKIVLLLCTPPNDTLFNVQTALKYVKAYNQCFWGQVCIVTGSIVFVGALAYGAATYGGTVIAGTGMTVAKWKLEVTAAIAAASSSIDRIKHILQTKHLWSRLTPNPNWSKITPYLKDVLLYGKKIILDNGQLGKQLIIDGNKVQVQYKILDGTLRIINGWVVK